jgi:hypothetical protein
VFHWKLTQPQRVLEAVATTTQHSAEQMLLLNPMMRRA